MADKLSKELLKYRSDLIKGKRSAEEHFDKAVLTLSGGGLGISFAVIDQFTGDTIYNLKVLIFSWSCWGVSIMSALLSYYLSPIAYSKAIKQLDKGNIYLQHPGGCIDQTVGICNFLSAFLFIAGVISIIIFVALNYR
jgi:hypothetical protein